MHDEEIRKILITYLQATYPDMRIYQEKNIGTSVCDVMAVTNELIGFEIKSNSDNLSRLPGQIKSYDSFFDKNYIVVGDKYGRYIHTKVPAHWGIVEIGETHIHIVRWASMNKEASCRKQLEILWKLELKNILIKNSLPLYAERDKAYIRDRILEHIPTKKLKKQIVTELLHRDYNVFTNTNNFHSYDLKENDVAAEIVDSLSEMNLSKFTLDEWISLYQQADEVRNEKEENFRKPIIERPPHAIIYKDIEVTLGAPWIDKHIMNEFIHELLETGSDKNIVEYEEVTGSWHIRDKNWFVTGNPNAELKYGLKKYNALWILEATLNLREIKLFDNGKVDESSTIAAIEKQKLIIEAFKEWVWKDEDRRWEIEEAYNKIFEPYDIKKYDGRNLEFQDMNPKYELFPYQKDAVEKIRMTPNTLLSFDVGAGKTYIMIAAAMMMRQEGFARKNMFVVPNHIVGQWEKIFTDLYPSAKVLAIEPKDFRPELRQKVLKQMQEGDYDGIIIAYSCFELIPLSTDSILDNMNQQVQRIDQAIQILRQRQGRIQFSQTYGESPLKREREYIESLTKDFLRSMRERSYNSITFDELGINTLFLDEAHNYKNIPIRTKLKNLNGINTKGSKKCLDMLHKVRCVQAQNNGRGVVFATGTPLCNSISDAYAMQMYLQYDDLEKHHLDVFDNWVKTFAKPEQLFEIDVNGTNYRMVRRFVKFHNLPELSRIFSQIAIFYAMGKQPELPECQEQIDVVIPKYKELSDYMVTLCKRSEEIRSKKINPKYDNMLKVSTDGRKAALSLELVGAIQPYHECSKVFFCVKNIVQMYEADANSTQVVFCDYSTPKGDQYSVYKELKERLIEAGIPDNEIAIIHHYTTESKKVALYQKFNDGEKRILIGSTFKLGTGANIQTKLKAIHHLDVPWRPADVGRILRTFKIKKNVEVTDNGKDNF